MRVQYLDTQKKTAIDDIYDLHVQMIKEIGDANGAQEKLRTFIKYIDECKNYIPFRYICKESLTVTTLKIAK